MSYDQVRQYLMSNPELWMGAKEGKEAEVDPVIAFLDKGKIKGVAGMNAALWNKAIDIIKAAYKAGKAAVEAVQEGIDFLKSKGEDIAKYQDKIDTITKGFENLAKRPQKKQSL